MIDNQRVSKYILYALGEIFLVVIGILIALQVNNWNEALKENNIEKELLQELKEDLNETLIDLNSDINTVIKTLEVTDSLYRYLYVETDRVTDQYKIPFWYSFAAGSLYPKQSAYQSIQSRGIHIIRNPLLRNSISDFYELFLKRIHSVEDGIEEMQDNELNTSFYKYAKTSYDCEGCQALSDILDTGNLTPFNRKSYFSVSEPKQGLDLQLMKYYSTNTRLLSLYKQAESIIRENQRLIDLEINK